MIQLYRSAFTVEAVYGFLAQQISGRTQPVTNTKNCVSTEVGMSMAPALWLVNFVLIYTLNPALAADMPAYWAPIPQPWPTRSRPAALARSGYGKYESYFP